MDGLNRDKHFTEGKSPHVLYLSYDGMTDPLGQSQVLPYLIGLTKKGLHFHLVSFEKKDRYELHGEHIRKICSENGIEWYPNRYTENSPLFTTLWDVQKMKKIAFELDKKYNFHAVHCRSYISALVGLKLKNKKGIRFIFDMRGFWADERVDGGLWNLESPVFKLVYKYFKRKEIQYLKKSDYVISLTQNAKEEMQGWGKIKNSPINFQVIPCCVDLNLFDSSSISQEEVNILKDKLEIVAGDFILGYVGSIGTWYMLSEMLDYFKIFLEQKPKARFLFVTGEKKERILAVAKDKMIDEEKIIVTACLHSDVPAHIKVFDLSVFFIKPTYSKKASSPTKQGEIMAMGVPLVCNSGVGDTDKIVRQYLAGVVIDNFNEQSYRKAVIDEESFDRKQAINGAKLVYSLEQGVENYFKVYKKLYE